MRLGRIRAFACLALATVGVSANAQYFRVVQKQAKPLDIAQGTVAVFTHPQANQLPMPATMLGNPNVKVIRSRTAGTWFVQANSSSEQLVHDFASLPGVNYAAPVFRSKQNQPIYFKQKIFLKMQTGISMEQGLSVVRGLGYNSATNAPYPGVIEIQPNSKNGFEVLNATNQLAWRNDIKYATANMNMGGEKALTPNDPLYPLQWAFKNNGQIAGNPTNPVIWRDMKIEPAWDITLGSPTIGILMLDDGLDLDHQDINRGLATDVTGEGIDGRHMSPFDFHGTLVAGCMTAITNNSYGIAGVAGGSKTWSARAHIMEPGALEGFATNPGITFRTQEDWVANALLWGLTNGCRVSNNSNCYNEESELITDMYLLTRQTGMMHFAAAGNDGTTTLPYPANDDSVRAVTGIDDQGFQIGTTGTDIAYCMPAFRIISTDRIGNFGVDGSEFSLSEFLSPNDAIGTSYASAYAAGVAALMLSVNPNLTPDLIDEILQGTAIDMIEPPTEPDRLFGYDDKWGWGLINAGQAVANAGYQGVVLSASAVRGGTNVQGTVLLLYPTAVGLDARLESSHPTLASVPPSVNIPIGSSSATFGIETQGVNVPTTVVITAIVNNVDRTASLTIRPPTMASIVITPGTFTGGNTVNALIKTSGIAGPDGCVITLASNGAAVRPPATATILTGDNRVNVPIQTFKTSLTITRTVTATTPDGLSKSASVTLTPVTTEISSFAINPASVEGGSATTGTITLTNPTPVGGINVNVTDTSSIVTPPPFVAFAQGETTKDFGITTKEVASSTNATVTVKYDVSSKSATLTVKPTLKIDTMTVSPVSVTGGFNAKLRIILYALAPAGGVNITLTDYSSAANTPASAFIPAGVKFVDVTIPTVKVNQNTSVRVRAVLPNGRFKETVFTVTKL